MNFRKFLFCIGLSALLAPYLALATNPAETLVRQTTTDFVKILKDEGHPGNEKKLRSILSSKILPFFDQARMTRLAVGKYWNTATPAQQDQLVKQFSELLVATYSNALTTIKVSSITTKPVTDPDSAKDVVVSTEVQVPDGAPLSIDYRLIDSGQGFKVVDVTVAGVSIVTTRRSTFAQIIDANGIDGLIQQLTSRNAELAKMAGG